MNKQEEIKKQERERIIALINLERDHHDLGVSLSLGKLIDAINGRDEEYKDWLGREEALRIRRERHHKEIGFDNFDTGYEARHMGRIDDLTTDLWGGAGPDCLTVLA